jgi:transcriptional regulator with XRE-family HTH domain
VTVPLSPTSPRRKAAIRFGALLVETLAARGVSKKSLARQLGSSGGLIWQWCAGNNLPRLETALRLSEALGEPRLATIVREARTQHCETCGTAIVNEGGSPIRFCTESCKAIRNQLRSGTPTRERAIVAERRLSLHRDAVAAFCAGCEPDGLCRDVDCALRPVSPLRLAKREAPTVLSVVPDDPRTLSEAHRAAIAAASARRWARPGESERTAAAVRATRATWTPERREAWLASISEGRRRQVARQVP